VLSIILDLYIKSVQKLGRLSPRTRQRDGKIEVELFAVCAHASFERNQAVAPLPNNLNPVIIRVFE
jgi:hypothetical protein